jgi:hypothetical protein
MFLQTNLVSAAEAAATNGKGRLRGLIQPAKAGFAMGSRGFSRQAWATPQDFTPHPM